MIKDNNKHKQQQYDPMTELELTKLAEKIDYENLELTEEEYAIGQIAKLMTLLNLFQEDEQYEKCAIVKRRLDIVNDILKKYDDEI